METEEDLLGDGDLDTCDVSPSSYSEEEEDSLLGLEREAGSDVSGEDMGEDEEDLEEILRTKSEPPRRPSPNHDSRDPPHMRPLSHTGGGVQKKRTRLNKPASNSPMLRAPHKLPEKPKLAEKRCSKDENSNLSQEQTAAYTSYSRTSYEQDDSSFRASTSTVARGPGATPSQSVVYQPPPFRPTMSMPPAMNHMPPMMFPPYMMPSMMNMPMMQMMGMMPPPPGMMPPAPAPHTVVHGNVFNLNISGDTATTVNYGNGKIEIGPRRETREKQFVMISNLPSSDDVEMNLLKIPGLKRESGACSMKLYADCAYVEFENDQAAEKFAAKYARGYFFGGKERRMVSVRQCVEPNKYYSAGRVIQLD